MVNLYFGIKMAAELIIVGIFVFWLLLIFIISIISSFKGKRIDKYLCSIGYKRTLISTAAFGTNHTYGYERNRDGHIDIIRDYELKGSLKQIKEKYK